MTEIRTGIGADTHRLVGGVPMHVAGLFFPDEPVGLAGHSDGDVVAHALCNAVFSAAGLGDMGSNFGTDQPEWAGASGVAFVTECGRRVRAAGWQIANVSVSVIGNRPRLARRRVEAEQVLTEALGVPVSLSATTTDGLGFPGEGLGVAAVASALVTRR